MRLAQLLDKTAAIVRRDLLTAVRYRTGFLITGAGAAAELAAFYYLSRAIGPGFRPEGVDYFPFLLVGTGFYTFLVMGINAFLVIVQEAQQTGTLEILMTTSTPAPVLVFQSPPQWASWPPHCSWPFRRVRPWCGCWVRVRGS